MLLHQLFEQSVNQSPDKEALVFEGTRYTYAEIDRRANQLAAALQQRGVQRGDRVATFLDNGVEAVVSIYAALKCGAVFMPINPLTKRDKLAYLLNDSRASALIAHAPLRAEYEDALTHNKTVHTCYVVGARTDAATAADSRCMPYPTQATQLLAVPPTIDQDLAGHHLHLRLHRRPQGRDAHAPEHGVCGPLDQHLPGVAERRPHRLRAAAGL